MWKYLLDKLKEHKLLSLFLIILIIGLLFSIRQKNNIEAFEIQAEVDEKTKTMTLTEKEKQCRIKQKVYKELLISSKKALDRLNIPFFLSSGTCLGFYREGKFLDHDYDIDLGIFSKDYHPNLVAELEKEGLVFYRVLGTTPGGLELSFWRPNTPLGKRAKIDIFLHYPDIDSDGKQCYSWFSYRYPDYKEKLQYRVTKFDLEKVDFLGIKVNVPYPTLRYIVEHYGEDWHIPRYAGKNYFYATSPKSIVKS